MNLQMDALVLAFLILCRTRTQELSAIDTILGACGELEGVR